MINTKHLSDVEIQSWLHTGTNDLYRADLLEVIDDLNGRMGKLLVELEACSDAEADLIQEMEASSTNHKDTLNHIKSTASEIITLIDTES